MSGITSLAVRRPLVVTMATVALLLFGLLAYRSLPVDLLPTTQFPFVTITVQYPGAGPREVEERVTKPIEDAVAGATDVKTITSTSSESFAIVIIEFRDTVDPDEAAREVERRVNLIRAELPDDIDTPIIQKYDPRSQPILNLAFTASVSPEELFRLADDTIRPRLESVDGVASVRIRGGHEREIQVKVRADQLRARGISLQQVQAALAANNLAVPSGSVPEGEREYSLRVYGLYQEVPALESLVVGINPQTGSKVHLRDIATVEDTFKKVQNIARLNGREGVAIEVVKQPTANTVAVSDGVHRAIEELRPLLPPSAEVAVVTDSARYVRASLDGVNEALRDAVIIVALVLLVFLHSWRSTVIVLIAIPTSIIGTFAVMGLLGFSMNMMSMLGLSLTIGILVDDSIVVLENIHRHMRLGETPFSAAINGRAEIGAAALAITLVDVIIFFPMAGLTGIVGQFFREFAIVIVVATLFSLVVSFTLTPMLASRWMHAGNGQGGLLGPLWRGFEAGFSWVERRYGAILGWGLRWRWVVMLIGLVAFVSGLMLVATGVIGSEFIPTSDRGELVITIDLPPGTSLETTNQTVAIIEERLARIPEIDSFLTAVGTGGQFARPQPRSARIAVHLKERHERQRTVFQVAEDVRALAADLPGVDLRTTLPNVTGQSQQPLIIHVKGPNLDQLTAYGKQIEEIVRRTPGTADVNNGGVAGAPEMRLTIDHQRAQDLGLSTADVGAAVRTAFEGAVVTQFRREGEDKVDVRLLYSDEDRARIATVPDIPLTTAQGTTVKLSQVARIDVIDGPSEINRENRLRMIEIGANLTNRPLGEVTRDLEAQFRALDLAPGYRVTLGGEAELQGESNASLGGAMVLSIVLMFMLMVALYESFMYPLVIMFALPVASAGAFGALALTRHTLNITSIVGLIMLTGLVAKNSILLVDYTNTLRGRGLARNEALKQAGPTRLRPILMTTAAMVFGMLPLAVSTSEGSETRAPMAVVVIGGLITSTLLTLVLVPAAYTIMDDLQGWFGRPRLPFRRRRPTAVPVAPTPQAETPHVPAPAPAPAGSTPPRPRSGGAPA